MSNLPLIPSTAEKESCNRPWVGRCFFCRRLPDVNRQMNVPNRLVDLLSGGLEQLAIAIERQSSRVTISGNFHGCVAEAGTVTNLAGISNLFSSVASRIDTRPANWLLSVIITVLMHHQMLLTSRLLLVSVFSLTLCGCKENQALQKELDAQNARLKALQQESFQMDQKMADFRKEIPASMGVGVAAAKNYAGLLAADLVATENQITQAQGQLKDAEMILAQIQKDIGMIKAKSAE